MVNQMKLEFLNRSENESFARVAVSAFITPLDPTVEELTEIKTAVSEAVSNAVIHAYKEDEKGLIQLECKVDSERRVIIIVSDHGVGIEDVSKAREPLYTSKPNEERSGMGFTVMESFMDKLEVVSGTDEGTRVTMLKKLDKAYGI
ncbi:anti-sigma F factor [Sinanaerobacter chloroacetimidivorans]|uniref:Anti-sigma F factor n=1 Tax=Sinanaerobacter chloroacetimidivorans TaxID=2818044 RepID=A0A8J7W5E0_9FIRM|nr:anti-sigma F factor [Sinanaerobacter chloroacetimidivorans]MBR0599505.1 anti-sigma F factor [Sinanaerobacter chloroacetimidivorans]